MSKERRVRIGPLHAEVVEGDRACEWTLYAADNGTIAEGMITGDMASARARAAERIVAAADRYARSILDGIKALRGPAPRAKVKVRRG